MSPLPLFFRILPGDSRINAESILPCPVVRAQSSRSRVQDRPKAGTHRRDRCVHVGCERAPAHPGTRPLPGRSSRGCHDRCRERPTGQVPLERGPRPGPDELVHQPHLHEDPGQRGCLELALGRVSEVAAGTQVELGANAQSIWAAAQELNAVDAELATSLQKAEGIALNILPPVPSGTDAGPTSNLPGTGGSSTDLR